MPILAAIPVARAAQLARHGRQHRAPLLGRDGREEGRLAQHALDGCDVVSGRAGRAGGLCAELLSGGEVGEGFLVEVGGFGGGGVGAFDCVEVGVEEGGFDGLEGGVGGGGGVEEGEAGEAVGGEVEGAFG